MTMKKRTHLLTVRRLRINLEKNDVTNIRKMKYIVIDNNGSLGIWVQTLEGAEYIIPYMTGTEELVSNNPYALNEVVDFIAK